MTNTLAPIDVWLKFDTDEDEDCTHEANTYMTDTGYRIDWYLNSVGLVTSLEFDTLGEAHAWYEREEFQDYDTMNSQNTPWELQDAEDSYTPLEPGESFNYLALACAIVLTGFLAALWML